jgi:hypothetical protein
MMRSLWIVFSMYIFCLSAIPCGDKENCNEFSETHATRSNDQDSHSDEACSPFCLCSCCGCAGFQIAYSPEFEKPLISPKENEVLPYASNFTSIYIASIWQPPKIG